MWSAIIFQAKSDLVGTFSVLRRIVGGSVSAAVPSGIPFRRRRIRSVGTFTDYFN